MTLRNIDVRVVGNTLTFTIDLSETIGETSKGTPLVAQASGFTNVDTPDGKIWFSQFMVGRKKPGGRDYESR